MREAGSALTFLTFLAHSLIWGQGFVIIMPHFLVCARVIPSLACEQAGFCEAKSTPGSFSRPLFSLPFWLLLLL